IVEIVTGRRVLAVDVAEHAFHREVAEWGALRQDRAPRRVDAEKARVLVDELERSKPACSKGVVHRGGSADGRRTTLNVDIVRDVGEVGRDAQARLSGGVMPV